MSRAVINSLREWSVAGRRRKKRLLACAPWDQRNTPPAAAKPGVVLVPHHGSKAAKVITLSGYEVHRQPVYPDVDWLTDEQRASVERQAAQQAGPAKPGHCPVAACRLVGYDDRSAECEMTVSGYEVPRASLPKWVLDAKNLKIGDRFFWIMRDANYILTEDIDTSVGPVQPRLSEGEQRRLLSARAEVARLRELDGGEWEDYTGPGQ